MMDLTIEEIDILIDAMTAWESRGGASQIMTGIMGAMLAKTDEQREAFQEQLENDEEKRKVEKRKDAEVSVLIKAKLIHMKDAMTAKAAADFMTS